MPQIKEIYVEASFTKNLGNYQSFKPTAGVTMTLAPEDNPDAAFKSGWELVGDQVAAQLSLFDENQKAGVKKGL